MALDEMLESSASNHCGDIQIKITNHGGAVGKCLRKSQGIPKVLRIRPVGGMNVSLKFHGKSSNSCREKSGGPIDQHCHPQS